jgi:hypothetical protein
MTGIPLVLQCARVGLVDEPLDGSSRVACSMCRRQVLLSRQARDLARTVDIQPVCEQCKPANAVTLTEDTWEDRDR